MLRSDLHYGAIEIAEVAGLDIHRPKSDAPMATVALLISRQSTANEFLLDDAFGDLQRLRHHGQKRVEPCAVGHHQEFAIRGMDRGKRQA